MKVTTVTAVALGVTVMLGAVCYGLYTMVVNERREMQAYVPATTKGCEVTQLLQREVVLKCPRAN